MSSVEPSATGPGGTGLPKAYAFTMIASAGSLCINLLTGTLTARLLGADGRGALGAVTTWGVMVSWICTFGFGDAMTYFQAKNQDDPKRVLGTSLLVGLVLALAASGAVQFVLPLGFRAQSAHTLMLARLSMLWLVPLVGMAFMTGLVSGHQRFKALNIAKLGQPLSYAVGLVLLWATGHVTVGLVLDVFFGSYLIVFVAALSFLIHRVGLGRPSADLIRRGARYGLKLQGHAFGSIGNARLDVLMLPAFVASSRIGLYVVAVSVSSVVVALFGNLSIVVFPAAGRAGGGSGIDIVERTTRLVLLGGTLSAGFLAGIGPVLIPVVYGSSFRGSTVLLEWLLPGTVLWGASAVLSGGLQAANHPGTASLAQLVGLVFTVVGLSLSVPQIGVLGAAITSTVAYSITFVATLWGMHAVAGLSIRRTLSPRRLPHDIRWILRRPPILGAAR